MLKFIPLFFVIFSACSAKLLSSSTCYSDEFPCSNGECIERLRWCDAEENCRDGSDEKFCKKGNSPGEDPNNCRPNKLFFLCLDGKCIPSVGLCDSFEDCDDNSDELNCTGSSNIEQKFPERLDFSEMQDFAESESLEIEKAQNRPLRLYRYVDESPMYKDLPHKDYRSQLYTARDWLMSQKKENFGWDGYTARAVIAMYLSKDYSSKTEEDLLMDKQLDIELAIALTRNETRTISLSDLALYVNALLAACKNPMNFYGHDLVQILRERADYVYSKKFASPLVHLALCLNNATEYNDVRALQEVLGNKENVANKIDIVSLAVLASSCIIKTPLYSHSQYRRNMVEKLLHLLKKYGLPGNIYEASLLMQALNEAKVDPLEWERDEAIEFILKSQAENGSFGDILATYYTMPILSGRSMLSLSDHCGKDFSNGKVPLAILKNTRKRKITVNYSLLFGDPVEMTQKVQLQVPEGTDFLNIMRLAEEENPNFRFKLDETKTFPFVYSIGGTPNDAECGRYWTLHIQNTRNHTDFFTYRKDIRELKPRDGEEIQFWLKQM